MSVSDQQIERKAIPAFKHYNKLSTVYTMDFCARVSPKLLHPATTLVKHLEQHLQRCQLSIIYWQSSIAGLTWFHDIDK